ncbi:hypothetical protein T484DRAFT_3110251 [Baffinella frigidus]|nr:hypothetical protein T484DRAFT_3110251 [Cryptophyta sp. CCMP2293]
MVQFAAEVSNALRTKHKTQIRVGIASGAITIAFINKHVFAPVMTVFGEKVCLAARMEQSGAAGLVHLSECATQLLCKEFGDGLAHPSLDVMEVKSTGRIPTSWICCKGLCFTDNLGRPLRFDPGSPINRVNFRGDDYQPDDSWCSSKTQSVAPLDPSRWFGRTLSAPGSSTSQLKSSSQLKIEISSTSTSTSSAASAKSTGSRSPTGKITKLRKRSLPHMDFTIDVASSFSKSISKSFSWSPKGFTSSWCDKLIAVDYASSVAAPRMGGNGTHQIRRAYPPRRATSGYQLAAKWTYPPGSCRAYRGTSLTRNRPPVGPCSRPTPKALWWP